MAVLGSLSLDLNGVLDSGLAQLLVKRPKTNHEFNYRRAMFRAASDTPFIICCFSGAGSHVGSITMGSELLQDGLDMLSMSGQADLATRDAPDEYLAWWRDGDKNVIAVVSTATFSFSVGPVTIEARDAAGQVVPAKPLVPQHHLGFRFYRLSQVSDDLFDAFRNMYLAFELLLSAKYPKGGEHEIDWLRASLAAAVADLDLASLTRSQTDPVSHIIDAVYLNARLPLFHAKDGRVYFAPLRSNEDRQEINNSLQLLTLIVIRMADVWHQTRRIGGGVNLAMMENANKQIFDKTAFVASSDPDLNLEGNLSEPAIIRGTRFEAKLIDQFNTQPRPHMYGCVDVAALGESGALNVLRLIKEQMPLMAHRLEAALEMSGFDMLEAQCFIRATNATEPRTLFPR